MKTSKKQPGIQTIFTKGKRVSLRCPLSIDRTEAEIFTETSAFQVTITLSNMGGGGLTNDTAESAIIVLRLYDENGNSILCAGNDYYAKSIRFGAEGLPSGEHTTFHIQPESVLSHPIHDAEVYISRVRFTDGTNTDYMRGDFFDIPGEGVLLTKKFKKNADEARKLLGEGASYLPEQLTEIVWRCTCGDFAESDICPTCGRKKADVFHALDLLVIPVPKIDTPLPAEEAAPLPPLDESAPADDKTAEYAISPQLMSAKATLDSNDPLSGDTMLMQTLPLTPPAGKSKKKHSRSTIVALTSIGISAVLFLILLIVLIFTIRSNSTSAETTTQTPAVTTPAPDDVAQQIVQTYLSANDFENALGFAIQSNLSDEFIAELYTKAILYYTSQQMPERALEFARRQGNTEKINELVAIIFDKQLAAEDYAGAMETADSLPDDQKEQAKKRAADGYVKNLIDAEDFETAMDLANQYQTSTTPQQIAQIALSNYLSKNDYDKAKEFAETFDLNDQIPGIAKKAALYYTEQSNLPKAMDYLKLAKDEATTRSIYVKLSDAQIRRYLPTFFGYLDFSKKQAVHACPIAAQPQKMVVLDEMGNVFHGTEMIYDAAFNGKAAVSVAACDTAVIALFSDGTVRILAGENSNYSQADIENWKKVVAISAGNFHILALTEDGKVLSAGKNQFNQCDTDGIKNAVMISAGTNHSLVLFADGKVATLGLNPDNNLSTEDWSDIVAISAGITHSIGIKSDGTAVGLGNCNVNGWKNVIAVVSGGPCAVGITTDHKVHYTASGKISYLLAGYDNVLWVSVRQNSKGEFIGVLNTAGSLTGIGLEGTPPAGIPLFTDLFGMQ